MLAHPLTRSPTRLLTHPSTHSLTHSLTRSPTYSLTHLLTRIYSLAHSPARHRTHPPDPQTPHACRHANADEGDLLAAAGVGYTIGREGTSQYGESGAGRRPLVNTSCGYGFKAAIDPFGPDGKVLPLIYGGPVAAVGAADAKVMAYNYRLCLTNATNPGLRVALVQPPDYDPAMWEAPRRYMKAHPPAVLSPEVLKVRARTCLREARSPW